MQQLETRQCLSWGPLPSEPPPPAPILFPDTAVADIQLEDLYHQFNSDNNINFTEMRALLISTADNGFTDRLEYLQLKRYLRLSETPDYVKYFTNAVLYGHYTDPSTIVFVNPETLVNKWFNGDNLPESPYDYIEVNGDLFVDDIQPSDVRQQRLNDCYFLSVLQALAINNAQIIRDMIVEVDNNVWVVKFFDNAGSPQFVTVDNRLPSISQDIKASVFADWGNDPANTSNELWPALLEKAYAQAQTNRLIGNVKNAYRSIEWGDPATAARHVIGQRMTNIKGMTKNICIEYLNNKQPLIIVYVNHTYTLEYFNVGDNNFFLRNPYGNNHIYATWEELLNLSIVGERQGAVLISVL